MSIKTASEALEIALQILSAMDHFQGAKELRLGYIKNHKDLFNNLTNKYNHEIDIYNRCIIRLDQRYKKQINKALTLKN